MQNFSHLIVVRIQVMSPKCFVQNSNTAMGYKHKSITSLSHPRPVHLPFMHAPVIGSHRTPGGQCSQPCPGSRTVEMIGFCNFKGGSS